MIISADKICMASLYARLWRTTKCTHELYRPFISSFKVSSSVRGNHAPASDDRHLLLRKCKEKLQTLLNSPKRYQHIDDREDRSDTPQKLIQCESVGRYLGRYRGTVILKSTNDLIVYYQLFSHIRPKTILEMGTFSGASALWCADSVKSLGLTDTHIYTVDIDPTLVSERMRQMLPDNVILLEGDYSKIDEIFPPEMLKSLPHPWVIIEDAHHFMDTVMEYLNDYMIVGDYLVAEDIEPRMPAQVGLYSIDEEIEDPWGTYKLDKLKKFIKSTGGQYMVDTFFADYYGYNSNWHWHGFLRKCS